MTPAERQLVADLFDRLATLEDAPRDPDAERVIWDGLRQAPNAVYALVQTVLLQDEALKRGNARIQELEAELGIRNEPPRQGGFLDTMRDSVFGRREEQRSSVPTVRPGEAPMGAPAGFRTGAQPMAIPGGSGPRGQPMQGYPEPQRGGGSFLGTAAAAAAGAIGGSLLLNSIQGMMGNKPGGTALADPAAAAGGGSGSPWGGGGGGSDDLARQLGRDDIGRSQGGDSSGQSGQGLFGDASDPFGTDEGFDSQFQDNDDDFDSGFDGGDGGDD